MTLKPCSVVLDKLPPLPKTISISKLELNSSVNSLLADNPWDVPSVKSFLHYCCPECSCFKDASKEKFIHHAISTHPNVRIESIIPSNFKKKRLN